MPTEEEILAEVQALAEAVSADKAVTSSNLNRTRTDVALSRANKDGAALSAGTAIAKAAEATTAAALTQALYDEIISSIDGVVDGGEWAVDEQYAAATWVYHNGGGYRSKVSNIAVEPGSAGSESTWTLFAGTPPELVAALEDATAAVATVAADKAIVAADKATVTATAATVATDATTAAAARTVAETKATEATAAASTATTAASTATAAAVAALAAADALEARLTVSPIDFGAVADGVNDDTDAVQAAIDSGASVIDFGPKGTYRLKCKPTSPFNYGNTGTNGGIGPIAAVPVYRAVRLNVSNITLRSTGAVVRLEGYTDTGAVEVNYMFSTDKHLTQGELNNITIDGLLLDFNPSYNTGAANLRSFYFGGCDDITFRNVKLYSSGARAGAPITLQNCRRVRFETFYGINITQAANFSFVYDIEMSNIEVDNFQEAFDFDRMCFNLRGTNLTFRNGTKDSAQAMDLNSVVGVLLKNVAGIDTGNVINISYKDTTPKIYAEYINGDVPTELTPSRDIVIDGIDLTRCGTTSNLPVVIGGQRFQPGYSSEHDDLIVDTPPCSGITLRGLRGDGSATIAINEGLDVILDDFDIKDGVTATSGNSGAVIYGTPVSTSLGSRISVTLRDIRIDGCPFSGVFLSACEKLKVSGLKVRNYGQGGQTSPYGANFATLDACKQGEIDGLDIEASSSAVTPTSVRLQGGAGGFMRWGDNNRLLDAAPLTLSSGYLPLARASERLMMSSAITTASNIDQPIAVSGSRKNFLARRTITPLANIAADGTNYVTWAVRKVTSGTDTGVNSGSFSAGLTSGVEVDLGTTQAALPGAGDYAYLRLNKAGSGGTLPAHIIRIYELPYYDV